MPYVNEYASEEDVQTYDLNGIWDKYYPTRKGKPYEFSPPAFTIDRERNIFLMRIRSGGEERSNRITFLLWWDRELILIEIAKVGGVKNNKEGLKSNPYIITWDMIGIYKESDSKYEDVLIIDELRKALTVHGYRGVFKQIPNTIVNFNF